MLTPVVVEVLNVKLVDDCPVVNTLDKVRKIVFEFTGLYTFSVYTSLLTIFAGYDVAVLVPGSDDPLLIKENVASPHIPSLSISNS